MYDLYQIILKESTCQPMKNVNKCFDSLGVTCV